MAAVQRTWDVECGTGEVGRGGWDVECGTGEVGRGGWDVECGTWDALFDC
jgi:hypothetical protein